MVIATALTVSGVEVVVWMSPDSQLTCSKSSDTRASHESIWKEFNATVNRVESVTLSTFPKSANRGSRSMAQLSWYFSLQDDELSDPLSIGGQKKIFCSRWRPH